MNVPNWPKFAHAWLRTATRRSARRVLAAGLPLLWSLLAAASPPKPDEQVVLFPTLGWRVPGGWEAEIHGCVFEPESRPILLPLLRRALGLDDDELTAEERAMFRDRARLFLVDHERGRTVAIHLAGQPARPPLLQAGPSAANGHFRGRLTLKDADLKAAGQTGAVVRVAAGAGSGSLAPPTGEIHLLAGTGVSVISDIDDTIKISEVRDRRALVRNTFCREFQPVPGMAEVFRAWHTGHEARFHYVSASPWQLYRPLADFTARGGFPAGTFHLKPFRVKDETFLDLFQSPERYKPGVIEPLLRQYPRRRWVLVGDSGERDPEIYGALARRFPDQIARVCIRDVTGEGADAPRYREAFAGLAPGVGRVFRDPAEIRDALPPSRE